MKHLVISDLHLTKKFNQKKANELIHLFTSVDRVIINGDFWESYAITFDDFIKSRWNILFSVLKMKKTVYIPGNHDEEEELDERVNLFSDTFTVRTELEYSKVKYFIEHGHKICGDEPKKNKFLRRVAYTNSLLELPVTFFSNGILQKIYSKADIEKLKSYSKKNLKDNEYLITGHTHIQEFDKDNKYINTGFNRFHYLQYATIDDDGKIELFKE
ncbi:MAG: metallophosphoesterase family protein [Candidatus Dojkabacteria bacterium]|nr:metallophosphoesterase family protein [Candidatus Dojkabacteria bacterium]MDQ7021612.1 metallophosphoesterase family protein [Candidatus Dojkabacteria bacterium]